MKSMVKSLGGRKRLRDGGLVVVLGLKIRRKRDREELGRRFRHTPSLFLCIYNFSFLGFLPFLTDPRFFERIDISSCARGVYE